MDRTTHWRQTHGLSASTTYLSWQNMRRRCFETTAINYKNYGGRGITVCERWLSFENFHADMGDKPEGLSLDRIDNDGNYEPGNCRWATRVEQNNNRSSYNNVVEFGGKRLTLTQWGRELFGSDLVRSRIRAGWTIEDALTTPVGKYTRPA